MAWTRTHPLRGLTAAALAGLALTAAAGAHAGVVVSTYTHGVDAPHDPLYLFNSDPFGFPANAVPVRGVSSSARSMETQRSRLPVGPNDDPFFQSVTDDSGLRSSTQAGQTVTARANVTGLPSPFVTTIARAQSAPYENHASARTERPLWLQNSTPVTYGDSTYEPGYFYSEHSLEAAAGSAWFETWSATGSGHTDITLALDGHLEVNTNCWIRREVGCAVSLPKGTDAFGIHTPSYSVTLEALFIVFDLDQLAFCPPDLLDECGRDDVGHPLPMNILSARYHGDEDLPLDFDDEWTLGFDAIAGHRYLVMGTLAVEAREGGDIDFFNTMRVTDVQVARGVLRSDATGGDVADLFARDPGTVPLPATLWLVLLGGGAVACQRRRRPCR